MALLSVFLNFTLRLAELILEVTLQVGVILLKTAAFLITTIATTIAAHYQTDPVRKEERQWRKERNKR